MPRTDLKPAQCQFYGGLWDGAAFIAVPEIALQFTDFPNKLVAIYERIGSAINKPVRYEFVRTKRLKTA